MAGLVYICLYGRFSKFNHNNTSISHALLDCDLVIPPPLKAPGLSVTSRMVWKGYCMTSEARPQIAMLLLPYPKGLSLLKPSATMQAGQLFGGHQAVRKPRLAHMERLHGEVSQSTLEDKEMPG